jgi:plastocyanin
MFKIATSILLAFFLFGILVIIPVAYAEEVITIVPGSQDKSRARFFDIIFYPIEKGKELSWFNADVIDHRIIITAENGSTNLSDSGVIKPKESFSYKFDNLGTYRYSSPTYPWMQGKIIVTDDISTMTATDLKNNIDVQISWTPSRPAVGQETHFKIIFIDESTDKNQEHIDYVFSIKIQKARP